MHIPKTAGSSLRKALENNNNIEYHQWQKDHHSLSTLLSRCEYHNFKPDYTFTVVRNPYDRFESMFSYYRSLYRKEYSLSTLQFQKEYYKDYRLFTELKFSQWIEWVLFERRKTNNSVLRTQSSYIDCDSDIKVFKFEDLHILENDLGIKLETINTQPKETIGWDTTSRDLVKLYYKQDFKRFNYE
jgi:hypothetical protein